ncbi:hypothetical protein Tco_0497335 [Tanacetum coccineum]
MLSQETMTTVDQGMSVEEIERVIAERVVNAIEAIAIYETKTNMARKSISQTEQQEYKVAENANNKRKWEGSLMASQQAIAMNVGSRALQGIAYQSERNQSHKNQIRGTRAHGVVHTLRGG